MKPTWCAAFLTLAALPVLAENNYHYTCTLDQSVRVISVNYLVAEQPVPCEVQYRKNEDTAKVLWRADNQEGFCEAKAKQMVKEHRQSGFTCNSDNKPDRLPLLNAY